MWALIRNNAQVWALIRNNTQVCALIRNKRRYKTTNQCSIPNNIYIRRTSSIVIIHWYLTCGDIGLNTNPIKFQVCSSCPPSCVEEEREREREKVHTQTHRQRECSSNKWRNAAVSPVANNTVSTVTCSNEQKRKERERERVSEWGRRSILHLTYVITMWWYHSKNFTSLVELTHAVSHKHW